MKQHILYKSKSFLISQIAGLVLVLFFAHTNLAQAQAQALKATSIRSIKNDAFQAGEVLKFKLHYGFVVAGHGVMQVMSEKNDVRGNNCLHIVGKAWSNATFDPFYKVRDRYDTFMDENAIVPWKFVRNVSEDGFVLKQDMDFNQYDHTAYCYVKKQSYKIPVFSQDIFSAFYYARCLFDIDNLKLNQVYTIPVFLDYEIFPMRIKYIGKEIVKSDLGTFRCLKFKPDLQEGRIFKGGQEMTLYVSDDKNKIPIQIKADILIGAVKISLTGYSGLRNPLSSKLN